MSLVLSISGMVNLKLLGAKICQTLSTNKKCCQPSSYLHYIYGGIYKISLCLCEKVSRLSNLSWSVSCMRIAIRGVKGEIQHCILL